MSKRNGETVTKALLKSLCCGNGWCYGVFWGFNQQNSLLLTLRDAYYDEQMGGIIDDMLLQVHVLGSGVVGQVAFTKKHKWMFSDSNSAWQSHHVNSEFLQDGSEFYGQFSCGIKTIAVILVEPFGVVQFGSMEKLPERMEFITEAKKLFLDIDMETFLPEISASPENGEIFPSLESLPSSITNSPYLASPETLPSPDFADLLEFDYQFQNHSTGTSLMYDISQSFSPVVGLAHNRLNSTDDELSCATNVISAPRMSDQTDILLNVCNSFNQIEKNLNNIGSKWTANSGCLSEHSNVSQEWPSNRLFSQLGLDQLLNDIPGSSLGSSSCNDQSLSAGSKRKRTGSPLETSYSAKTSQLYSNLNIPLSKDHESTSKATKKKAKRGTRPVPKDRIRTYERLAELRKLVPNGEKMSIDRLLNQTIKQLLFLQRVTKRAEELKNADVLKERKGQKETGFNSNANGVTWVCEIENQTMVCPLKVEELCTPGQMLIEILCQEQGFFLEIVDIVRGFGLNILKGVMELRVTKIWAHFVVEAEENQIVSRHEIFSSLLQLLQVAGPSELCLNDQVGSIRDGMSSPLNSCSEYVLPFIGMPEGIPCMNLV
ncbi:unnamed protein product [Cuscuta epithymum]|uniref:BHLH domain-containing protein n=1 Tax=Cuscuta epithymum TaxID=186058 RepID=A0AAV0G095_9ASTE|nr:unnamed protein product [Cuscuta epithymum]